MLIKIQAALPGKGVMFLKLCDLGCMERMGLLSRSNIKSGD